ncbi:MAG TPA: hypothetical protein VGL36_35505 [Kribbella sp.]
MLFVKVRESGKAKVDLTADALQLSATQILDAVIERAEIDRFGVVGVPLELVRRARDGGVNDLPTLYGHIQVHNKAKIEKFRKGLKISQAVLMDAILQQVPVLPDGTIAWGRELLPPQADDLLSEIDRVQEAKQAS